MVTKIQTIPTTVDKEKDQQTATQQVVKQKYKASELLALRLKLLLKRNTLPRLNLLMKKNMMIAFYEKVLSENK